MKRREVTKLFAALLAAVLLLCACQSGGRTVRFAAEAAVLHTADATALTCDVPRENQTRVSRSDMTVLYYDETSKSISIYDAAAKQLWRALPETAVDPASAMLRLHILAGKQEYTLSSQSDATLDVQTQDGSLLLTYTFFAQLDRKTAVHYVIPLRIAAEDGRMRAQIDCSALRGDQCMGDVTLLSMEVLPTFGAFDAGDTGDFLFVPDGCGALIDVSTRSKTFEPLTLTVYGDPAQPQDSVVAVPAFGMKRGDAAFLTLIEDGDAMAAITAEKAYADSGMHRVGAVFTITPFVRSADGQTLAVLNNSYNGTISLSYRFLSGDNANVAGMAAACRELLVRNGTLDLSAQREPRAALPLHLELIGAAAFAEPGKGSHIARHTVTTLAAAEDMLSLLRNKGISAIDLSYRGLFPGALTPKDSIRVVHTARGGVTLDEFSAFAAAQGVTVYPEIALTTAKKGSVAAAKTPFGKRLLSHLTVLSGNRVAMATDLTVRSASALEHRTAALLTAVRTLPAFGLVLSDAGLVLAGDGTCLRQTVKLRVQDALASLFAARQLLVRGGNIYALKYAGAVTELPHTAFHSGDDITETPFLQMLLHGYTDYSGTPLNLNPDGEDAFLKAAEYGEVLAYAWYNNDYGNDDVADNYHYLNTVSEVQQYYERLNAAFADLADKKMTAHTKLDDGVFCTTFGTATDIYVNYNDAPVTVHGITIEAKSFLRVN